MNYSDLTGILFANKDIRYGKREYRQIVNSDYPYQPWDLISTAVLI